MEIYFVRPVMKKGPEIIKSLRQALCREYGIAETAFTPGIPYLADQEFFFQKGQEVFWGRVFYESHLAGDRKRCEEEWQIYSRTFEGRLRAFIFFPASGSSAQSEWLSLPEAFALYEYFYLESERESALALREIRRPAPVRTQEETSLSKEALSREELRELIDMALDLKL